MPKHRLNLFQLPATKVADDLRAASPRVPNERAPYRFASDAARRRASRKARSATIDMAGLPSVIRVTLSTGGTAHRDENGDWQGTHNGVPGQGYGPLGKRWRAICESAYQAALMNANQSG